MSQHRTIQLVHEDDVLVVPVDKNDRLVAAELDMRKLDGTEIAMWRVDLRHPSGAPRLAYKLAWFKDEQRARDHARTVRRMIREMGWMA